VNLGPCEKFLGRIDQTLLTGDENYTIRSFVVRAHLLRLIPRNDALTSPQVARHTEAPITAPRPRGAGGGGGGGPGGGGGGAGGGGGGRGAPPPPPPPNYYIY
jgi:hypothetical protein